MINFVATINHLGHKQYAQDHGPEGNQEDYVCPCCGKDYTNQGEGVLCDNCADNEELFERQTVDA